jgi:chromosome segregation ATPase
MPAAGRSALDSACRVLPNRNKKHNRGEKQIMSQARTNLKAAVTKIGNLTTQIENLEAAADRADDAAEQARAELEKSQGLEKEITAWRVAQVKKGLSTKTLPENLKVKTDAKRAAEEELEQAESTHNALSEELEELQACLKPAEQERLKCAHAVLHDTGDELAQELVSLQARHYELMQLIMSLAQTIGLTPEMEAAVLNQDGRAQFPGNCDPIAAMAMRWKDRLEAVLKDPDAPLTVPKQIVPSDFVIEGGQWQGPGLPFAAVCNQDDSCLGQESAQAQRICLRACCPERSRGRARAGRGQVGRVSWRFPK